MTTGRAATAPAGTGPGRVPSSPGARRAARSAAPGTRPSPAAPGTRPAEPLLRTLLGAALRRRREGQGRTLTAVAAEARMSTAYLSEIERGRKEPSSEVLVAVCRALGLRLGDLLVDAVGALRADAIAALRTDGVGALRTEAGRTPSGTQEAAAAEPAPEAAERTLRSVA